MAEHESMAIWAQYLRGNTGVTIKTTYARLKQVLTQNTDYTIYLGKVKYLDYSKERFPPGNLFNPFMHKRIFYKEDVELRALITTWTSLELRKKMHDWIDEAVDHGRFPELKEFVTACRENGGMIFKPEEREKSARLSLNLERARSVLRREKHPLGITVSIDLNGLIEVVYLSPGASSMFKMVIESIANYIPDRKFDVRPSAADDIV